MNMTCTVQDPEKGEIEGTLQWFLEQVRFDFAIFGGRSKKKCVIICLSNILLFNTIVYQNKGDIWLFETPPGELGAWLIDSLV